MRSGANPLRTDSLSAAEARRQMIRDMKAASSTSAPHADAAPRAESRAAPPATSYEAHVQMIRDMGAVVSPDVLRRGRSSATVMRHDFVDLSKATVTPEGWVKDSPIVSRSGVFNYPQPDGTVRREYRPPEEVFRDDALASLRGAPITVGHPGAVSAAKHTGQIIGTVLTSGRRDGSDVVADIVIHNPNRMGNLRELSLGYQTDLDHTPGTTPEGQAYDVVQRNIRINHLAVVERGRAGNARLRLDKQLTSTEARAQMIKNYGSATNA